MQVEYEKNRDFRTISLHLGNDTGYDHSYNQGHDIVQRSNNSTMVQNELCLQWQINRTLYIIYQMVPVSMSLNDP